MQLAEREGFEPSVPCGTHDFQSCPFGLSGISPDGTRPQHGTCRPQAVNCDVRAEREGFEPPVPLRIHLISNQAQSTRLCHLSIYREDLPSPPHPAKPSEPPPTARYSRGRRLKRISPGEGRRVKQ